MHKAFVSVMVDANITDQDKCVMLTFPVINDGSHIVTRPKYVEAKNVGELRAKIIAELDAQLHFVPGMASAAAAGIGSSAPARALTPINMDCLSIEGDIPTAKGADFIDLEA